MEKGITGVRELRQCLPSIQICVYTQEMQSVHIQQKLNAVKL